MLAAASWERHYYSLSDRGRKSRSLRASLWGDYEASDSSSFSLFLISSKCSLLPRLWPCLGHRTTATASNYDKITISKIAKIFHSQNNHPKYFYSDMKQVKYPRKTEIFCINHSIWKYLNFETLVIMHYFIMGICP